MFLRTHKRNVTFKNSFNLGINDTVYLPGVYCVETIEEILEGKSFLTFIEVATIFHTQLTIEHPRIGLFVFVSTVDLDAALFLDLQKEMDKRSIEQFDNDGGFPFN